LQLLVGDLSRPQQGVDGRPEIVAHNTLDGAERALKHGTDLDTPSLGHQVIAAYLEAGGFPAHLERLRREYRRRRDAMLAALAAHLPPGARWTQPAGGMYVWLELPPEIDATALRATAIDSEGVAFSPGEVFAAGGGGHGRHCLRLAFAGCPPGEIEEGIRRLARAVVAVAPS
jgi:2-aminoadipate transaminase